MAFSGKKIGPEWQMLATAAVVVIAAQMAMTGLTQLRATFDIVSQNAIAPDASPSMPAIAANPVSAEDCSIIMDLLQDDHAMIGVTLLAPCLPNTDVLISHAGLVFSAKTIASGSLFLSLPALTEEAKVAVKFSTGETAEASITIPEVKSIRRFAVQWPENDGFSLHAYEGNAGFDDLGHIWAENLATPLPGKMQETGYLTALGDPSTNLPMLAQIYTYPTKATAEVIVEAAVTANTCGFDLMGDAISSVGGVLEKTEMTVAMPDCTAIGEFVQLPDLSPDLILALAD